MIKVLELLVPPFLEKGEGLKVESANGQWLSQSRLCNKASIKTQEVRLWKTSRLVIMWVFQESGVPIEGMEAPHLFPTPALHVSSV